MEPPGLLSVPDEVLRYFIFSPLQSKSEWCSLSLVCRRFQHLLYPLLYRTLDLSRLSNEGLFDFLNRSLSSDTSTPSRLNGHDPSPRMPLFLSLATELIFDLHPEDGAIEATAAGQNPGEVILWTVEGIRQRCDAIIRVLEWLDHPAHLTMKLDNLEVNMVSEEARNAAWDSIARIFWACAAIRETPPMDEPNPSPKSITAIDRNKVALGGIRSLTCYFSQVVRTTLATGVSSHVDLATSDFLNSQSDVLEELHLRSSISSLLKLNGLKKLDNIEFDDCIDEPEQTREGNTSSLNRWGKTKQETLIRYPPIRFSNDRDGIGGALRRLSLVKCIFYHASVILTELLEACALTIQRLDIEHCTWTFNNNETAQASASSDLKLPSLKILLLIHNHWLNLDQDNPSLSDPGVLRAPSTSITETFVHQFLGSFQASPIQILTWVPSNPSFCSNPIARAMSEELERPTLWPCLRVVRTIKAGGEDIEKAVKQRNEAASAVLLSRAGSPLNEENKFTFQKVGIEYM